MYGQHDWISYWDWLITYELMLAYLKIHLFDSAWEPLQVIFGARYQEQVLKAQVSKIFYNLIF